MQLDLTALLSSPPTGSAAMAAAPGAAAPAAAPEAGLEAIFAALLAGVQQKTIAEAGGACQEPTAPADTAAETIAKTIAKTATGSTAPTVPMPAAEIPLAGPTGIAAMATMVSSMLPIQVERSEDGQPLVAAATDRSAAQVADQPAPAAAWTPVTLPPGTPAGAAPVPEEAGASESVKVPPRHVEQAGSQSPVDTRPLSPTAPGGRPLVPTPELGTTASQAEPVDPPPGSDTYDLGPTPPPSTDTVADGKAPATTEDPAEAPDQPDRKPSLSTAARAQDSSPAVAVERPTPVPGSQFAQAVQVEFGAATGPDPLQALGKPDAPHTAAGAASRPIDHDRIQTQVLRQILATETPASGEQKVTLQLNPEHLGKVEVRLIATGERLEVVITAENAEAEQALREGAKDLLRSLTGQQAARFQHVEIKVAAPEGSGPDHEDVEDDEGGQEERRDRQEQQRRRQQAQR